MVAILIVLTIVGFVVADALIQRSKVRQARAAEPDRGQVGKSATPRYVFENLDLPQGVFVAPGHTWLSVDSSGTARVGLDDFAQRVIGRIDAVELPQVGTEVRRGDRLFAVRQGKRLAEFSSPVDAVVQSVNEVLTGNTEQLKANPFGQGWVCALNPSNLARDLKGLSIAEEAREWLGREVQRFLSFIVARPAEHMALGHVLQDGGELSVGLLEMLDDETWGQFNQRFLKEKETKVS